ncbi:MAG: hypothetical protein F6K31_04265 [Symploca sp. SIO2G7]|nr:hypothetical protein [Symploca sp. SIO2G7]
MTKSYEPEKIFLEIGFRSPESEGSLRTIELLGVPGEKLPNGECVVNQKVQRFFDDLIVRRIFYQSRQLPDCNFEYLKIWLYSTDTRDAQKEYAVPQLDSRDLEISSNNPLSKLEKIYVLDNGLKNSEYARWKKTAEQLFNPLFQKFVLPPEPPSIEANSIFNPLLKFVENVHDSLDSYSNLKRNLFFNALIIQID